MPKHRSYSVRPRFRTPHSSNESSFFAGANIDFARRDEVVEEDPRRQQRADAEQHLQHLERVDVVLAVEEHAGAARQDQRVLAEERLDRLVDRAALVRFANVERVRSEVDDVVAELDRLAHPADGAVALEHGHRNATLGQPPRGGDPRRPGAQHDDSRLL